MSTRASSSRNRATRPETENLEDRRLLSATVSGTDIDGDTWTLRLIGPGSLVVTKQNDSTGNPAPLNSASQIDTITIAGTNPLTSRIVGNVHKGANGNGVVYFQNLVELSSKSERLSGGQGPLSIDMPKFYAASTTAVSGTTAPAPPSITIPDGVTTLRFGGVDTSVGQNPNLGSGATSDTAEVVLGLPEYGGTRLIIDKSVSTTQSVPPASGSTSTTPTTVQHGVNFAVSGRLSLFQANSIQGDATHPPGQFGDVNANQTPPITASGTGGTTVVSGTGNAAPFFPTATSVFGGATGAIGDFRVGGNATNLSAAVFDTTGSGDARMANFSIGGETNNVLVIAPNGLKTATFGLGMDKVDLLTHVLNTLQANRGAVDSNVYVDRTISRATFGGNVVDTTVLTGVNQSFSSIFNTITGSSSNPLLSNSPAPPPRPTNAQNGGGLQALVAGDVTDSVFSASVQPFNDVFGSGNDLVLPTGHITAKVEGKIDNTNATPNAPSTAFYAQRVDLKRGPVVPPNVPQPPYPKPAQPTHEPGVPSLNAGGVNTPSANQATTTARTTTAGATRTLRAATITPAHATPHGPRTTKG